jgi:MFS family permease
LTEQRVAAPAETSTDPFARHHRWNALAFAIDMGLFMVGMNFINATVVLPSFVTALGGNELAVGLANGLASGGWLLPQLVIAGVVARMPRKKPIIVSGAWISRPLMLVLALIIWLLGESLPRVTMIVTMATVFIFFVFDAVVSVPWFDLVARALPARRRGRILGTAQVLGGIGGIGAGVFVRYILGDASPLRFPNNYAILYVIAALFFTGSTIALMMIREPEPQAVDDSVPRLGAVLMSLPRILMQDRPFLRLVIVRVLGGFVTIASAFYVLHATQHVGLSYEATGFFVSAQVAGSLFSGLLMGMVQDRWGPRTHIRTILIISGLPAVIALGINVMAGTLGQAALYPYLLLYFFLGINMSSIGWPFFNWVLEYAPEAQRPLYIGMINTLAALTMLAPTLGGWIIRVASYPAVFATALGFAAVALLLSLTLPSTRNS